MKTEGKIPIVIGVTGHRNLVKEEISGLRDAVREELRRIRETCPSSPLLLLSSLAAGADRLCAEVGLEEGFELSVPLPMPLEEYEKDFQGNDLQQLKTLINRAREVFVVNEIEPHQDGRDYRYRQAGIYIAEHCHVLIALWDGEPLEENGCGTATIVSFKLHHSYQSRNDSSLHPSDRHLIWICVSCEGKIVSENDTKRNCYKSAVIKYGKASYTKLLMETNDFNREAESGHSALPESADAENDAVVYRINQVYNIADDLSVKNARIYRWIIFLISLAATLVTFLFLLYDEAELHCMILACGILVGCLFLLNSAAKRLRCHKKYIEYRILAEGLRVQNYLFHAGMTAEVWDIIPWAWQVNTPWIRSAFSALVIGETKREKHQIINLWIKDQRAYHEKAYTRTERKNKTNNCLIAFALGFSILSYFAALGFEVSVGNLWPKDALLKIGNPELVRTWLKIIMGSLSALTLFAGNYYGKLSLDETLNDHSRMISLYEMAEEHIQREGETEEFLYKLAREELGENGRWYAYQSLNKPEISL